MIHALSSLRRAAILLVAIVAFGATSASAADYANPDLLTSTETLGLMLEDPNVRVVDVRPREAYDAGHIPGAIHLSADDIIDPVSHVDGDLLPLSELAAMLGERGIGPETRVVFYDDRGGFHASRLFWLLEYLGHRQVSVLNGGFPAWEREGWSVSQEAPTVEPTVFPINLTPRRAASADWLMERRDDPSVVVIDVRPTPMFEEGHIPWARNIPWAQNLNEDGIMRSAEDLLAHFAAHGVTPDDNIAVHCQNGKASAHSYLTLRLLGFQQVRSYDRSWAEWGHAYDLPTASSTDG
ncbi:MAG: sulfurtransferase [Pseudomonadota bacterium]